MNHFLESKLFSLLADTSQEATNQEMQRAYEKFITHVDTISNVGNDLTNIIRKLTITRIELVFLLKQIQYEQGKKCA